MDTMQIRKVVIEAIADVAPEADVDGLDSDVDIAEELDLDSMDSLNVFATISEELDVDIPEREYGQLRTLDQLVSYLEQKVA